MSGIFLYFNPAGLSPEAKQKFLSRLETRTTRVPDDKVESQSSKYIAGCSIHHGFLPSGGTAESPRGALLVSGSCWHDPTGTTIDSPPDLLAYCLGSDPETMPLLGGVFSLAFCNTTSVSLMAEADRFGAMPLYYRQMGGGVAVSTEIKFLVEPGKDKLNADAMGEMMGLGYMPRPHTLISGIQRLPAFSRLICDSRGLRVIKMPCAGYPRNKPVDDDAIEQYDELVRRFLKRFQGLSSCYSLSLSGGLDSRLLAMAALREGFPLKSFTTGEKGSLEAKVASQVAEMLDIPIHVHDVDGSSMPRWFTRTVWFTEGRVMAGHMHYMSANFLREVPPGPQLHGLAGETVMGGHFDNAALETASPEEIRKACFDTSQGLSYWPQGMQETVFSDPLIQSIKESKPAFMEEIFDRIGFSGTYSDFLDFRFRFRMEGFSNPCLMSQVLPWTDVVCPFIDGDAFDFGASMQLAGIADRGGQLKWGLRYFPDIAKLPRIKAGVEIPVRDDDPTAYARGARRLAREVKAKYYLTRLSGGRINLPIVKSFPFYGQWYRRWERVRNYVDGILLSEQTLDRGLFHREGIVELLHDCRVGRNTWGAIGTLLMVELFLRQFLDGTDIPEDPVTPWGFDG